MSGNTKKIIAFNYFGGKFTWLDHLYAHFPTDFIHLVDLFAGSFAVSLNYQGKCIKTANEINGDVTNFYEVLRNSPEEFLHQLSLTPIGNLEYDNCYGWSDSKVERARRFYVRARQSFFGLGAQRKNKGWHFAKSQLNCTGGETMSKFLNGIDGLINVAKVIRESFQITNWSYELALEKSDFDKAFFYVDPPYPEESRKSKNDYKFEFTDHDHWKLARRLFHIQGKFMISGYDCDLMRGLYAQCVMVKFPTKKNNIRSGTVQECIWMNYEPPVRVPQLELI
jgi:DNA adenine methylase